MTELEEYYNKFNEEKRLNSRHGRVEFITSMKYIHCLLYTSIRQILSEYKSPKFDYLPSFTGGLVGYFSYDYLGYKEKSIRGKAVSYTHLDVYKRQMKGFIDGVF